MLRLLASIFFIFCVSPITHAQAPEWAYQVNDGELQPRDESILRSVPGSDRAYTQPHMDNHWTPPDWFPEDHAPLPPVVADGAGPNVRACAACHLASGAGHPESSHLAGLPVNAVAAQPPSATHLTQRAPGR